MEQQDTHNKQNTSNNTEFECDDEVLRNLINTDLMETGFINTELVTADSVKTDSVKTNLPIKNADLDPDVMSSRHFRCLDVEFACKTTSVGNLRI